MLPIFREAKLSKIRTKIGYKRGNLRNDFREIIRQWVTHDRVDVELLDEGEYDNGKRFATVTFVDVYTFDDTLEVIRALPVSSRPSRPVVHPYIDMFLMIPQLVKARPNPNAVLMCIDYMDIVYWAKSTEDKKPLSEMFYYSLVPTQAFYKNQK